MLYFNHEERTALKIIKELYGGNHMKNERIIEGLNSVIEGLTVLKKHRSQGQCPEEKRHRQKSL